MTAQPNHRDGYRFMEAFTADGSRFERWAGPKDNALIMQNEQPMFFLSVDEAYIVFAALREQFGVTHAV